MTKPTRPQPRPARRRRPSASAEGSLPPRASTPREDEQRYRRLFENAVEGMYQTTPDGRYLELNPALARLLGFETPAETMAAIKDIARQVYVEPARREEFVRALETDGIVRDFESQIRRRDGSVIWVCEHGRCVRDDAGQALYYEGSAQDITPRKQAEQALRTTEERYALAVRAANDGLWDWDLETGVAYYSTRWKTMLGLEGHDLAGTIRDWFDRIHSDDLPRVKQDLDTHLAGHSEHFESEFRIQHRDGSRLWVLCRGLAVFDADGRALRMAGSQSDITKRKVAEERLFHDAFHDALTGLPNRTLFIDRLGRSIWRARRREDYRFAVVFLDLDRVKLVNDSLGHGAGDRLLLAIARRIQDCLRAGDSAARIGGDEFAVLIEDLAEPADAIRVVTRLQQAIREPLNVGGEMVYTTASIGIALYSDRYERAEEMLRDADTAMDAARAAGGGRYQTFDQGMHERVVARLQIESGLRRAIERSEFRAFYQPVVALQTGRLAGFEALIRWQHPDRGLVPPVEFIPIAEETGLIHKLGRWILREACDQMARWTREFSSDEPLRMSVNLSGRQLAEADLVARTVHILQETGLAPGQLTLEITESAVMQDAALASSRLAELRALGIGIGIDDFGTGYSSLSYLHRLPLTVLKIDRTFVWAMGPNARETQICHGIVDLAQNLDLTVIAEGIETQEQRQRLQDLHCEYGQGYLFAKPLPADEASELLRSGRSW